MKPILFIAFLLVSSLSMAQWQNVGLGFTGGTVFSNGSGANALSDVHGMIVYNNDLYVWGDFDSVDGKPAKNFARYDGSQWHSLPYTGIARDMEVFQGELYIAGYTGTASNLPGRYITKWDGVAWSALDTSYIVVSSVGEDGPYDLEVYKNALYLGGRSFNIGSQGQFPWQGIFNHIGLAKWTGSSWDSIENGYKAQGTEYYFSLYKDSLIIADYWSNYTITGFDPARWFYYNGSNWHKINEGWIGHGPGVQLGKKFFRAAGVVGTDTGQFYFDFTSQPPSHRIIKHDNKILSIRNFRNIQITDSNLNFIVIDSATMQAPDFMEAICVYRDTLFVGGNFTTLGGVTYNGIMKYEVPLTQVVIAGAHEALSGKSDMRVYPNPATTNFIVKGEIPKGSVLELFTIQGEKVQSRSTSRNTNSIQIELSDSPPGIYVVKIHTPERSWESRIVKQ